MIALRTCLLALLLPLCVQAADHLPARNLVVEWRVVDAVVDQRSSGMIVLRSNGSGTRAGVSVGTRGAEQGAEEGQRLVVLNGSTASVQLAQSQPWQFVQAAWQGGAASSPRGGVAMGTQWLTSGQSLMVRPRWNGGTAPVSVELQADAAEPVAEEGRTQQRLSTTLQLPLDRWTTVAERAGGGARQTLQMRVSAP